MTPEGHGKLPQASAAVEASVRVYLDPAQVPTDARRFRRLPVPAPLGAFGAAYCLALDEVGAEAQDASDVEISGASLPASFGRAVRSRVRSHLAGRHCAARALAQLPGVVDPGSAIPVGALGAPVWPAGIVGSISHSAAIAAAVVAPAHRWRGLGIDCERIMHADRAEEIVHMIVPEAAAIHVVGGRDALPWGTLVTAVFSTKESVYKCLAPLTGAFFDFPAVHAEEVDPASGTMRLRVVESLGGGIGAGLLLTGRFRVDQGHVFSAVGLPPA